MSDYSRNVKMSQMHDLKKVSAIEFNDKYLCVLKSKFSAYEKDNNSPSLFAQADVDVYDSNDGLTKAGIVLLQKDDSQETCKDFAMLFIRNVIAEDSRWTSSVNIVNAVLEE